MRWQSKSSGKDIGTITISLGVAQFAPGEDLNTLIQRADKALYQQFPVNAKMMIS